MYILKYKIETVPLDGPDLKNLRPKGTPHQSLETLDNAPIVALQYIVLVLSHVHTWVHDNSHL